MADPVAVTEIERVATRGELACLICHDPSVALDHVRERSTAPEARDDPWNLAPLCEGHHRAKTLKVIKTRVVQDCGVAGGDCYEWARKVIDRRDFTHWLHVPVRVNERTGCLDFATDDPTAVTSQPQSPHESDAEVVAPAAVGSGRRLRSAAKSEGRGAESVQSVSTQGLAAEPIFYPAPSEASEYCWRGMQLLYAALIVQKATTEVAFQVGDWVNEGDDKFGKKAAQFQGVFSYWQIATWASVARRVPFLCRHKGLPLGHHQIVAALPEPRQKELLDAAAAGAWKRDRLKEEIGDDAEPQVVAMGRCPKCGHTAPRSEFSG